MWLEDPVWWGWSWRWNLIKICVWTCDMNWTLGSVVPLAMFDLSSCKSLRQHIVSTSARSNNRKKQQGVVSWLLMKLARKTDSTWQTNNWKQMMISKSVIELWMIFLSHLGGKCQQIECIIDTTHSIAALPFAFVQASATLLAFRFFPRAPWALLPSKFLVPSCNSLPLTWDENMYQEKKNPLW